jgi:hypothetical protein
VRLFLLTLCLTLAAPVFAQDVSLQIDGPGTVEWGSISSYKLIATVDGKSRMIAATVEWSVTPDSRTTGVLLDAEKKFSTVRYRSATAPSERFASQVITLTASVDLQLPGGTRKVSASSSITISNAGSECEKLKNELASLESQADTIARTIRDLKIDLNSAKGAKGPTTNQIAEQQKKVDALSQTYEARRSEAEESQRLRDNLIQTRKDFVTLRNQLESSLPEAARIFAAKDRYNRLKSRGRRIDKVDFLRSINGEANMPRPSTSDAEIDALVAAAEKKVLDVGLPRVGYALVNIGGVVTAINGTPNARTAAEPVLKILIKGLLNDDLIAMAAGAWIDAKIDPASFTQNIEEVSIDGKLLGSRLTNLVNDIQNFEQEFRHSPTALDTSKARQKMTVSLLETLEQVQDQYRYFEYAESVQKGEQLARSAKILAERAKEELDSEQAKLAVMQAEANSAARGEVKGQQDRGGVEYRITQLRKDLVAKLNEVLVVRQKLEKNCGEAGEEAGTPIAPPAKSNDPISGNWKLTVTDDRGHQKSSFYSVRPKGELECMPTSGKGCIHRWKWSDGMERVTQWPESFIDNPKDMVVLVHRGSMLKVKHSHLNHVWKTHECNLNALGDDSLTGSYVMGKETGSESWQRQNPVIRELATSMLGPGWNKPAVRRFDPGEAIIVEGDYNAELWSHSNERRANRPVFTIDLYGDNLWGFIQAELPDAIDYEPWRQEPIFSKVDSGQPHNIIGRKFYIALWENSGPGIKTLRIGENEYKLDIRIAGYPER